MSRCFDVTYVAVYIRQVFSDVLAVLIRAACVFVEHLCNVADTSLKPLFSDLKVPADGFIGILRLHDTCNNVSDRLIYQKVFK